MSTLRSRQETWRKLGLTSVSETHARDEFDRFGPLKKVPIREPPKKDRLEKLRELRELLKSGKLDPKTIHSMMEFYPNLNAFEAVERAEREGALIVPNLIHDRVLNQTDVKYLSWTGTLIIYEAPNRPFGNSVIFHWTDEVSSHYSLSFQIPEEHSGRVNCALVIESPDFTFVKTGENKYEVKLTEGAVVHQEQFPAPNNWYAQNDFGIPSGTKLDQSQMTRYLWRADFSYINLLVRNGYVYNGQGVDAGFQPSNWFGVALIG